MENTDLRTEFTTETKTRFNVEWVAYNDYVEWLEQKLVKLLTIPQVVGSFIKELEWVDKPEKRQTDIYPVVARADVPMPHTVGNACIEITDEGSDGYDIKLWCFNKGTGMNENKYIHSIDEAKIKASEWWNTFISGFLNYPLTVCGSRSTGFNRTSLSK